MAEAQEDVTVQFVKDGPHIPLALLEAQEAGNLVFFVGAGVSMGAGLPSFDGLVKLVAAKLGYTDVKKLLNEKACDGALKTLEARYGVDNVREALSTIVLEAGIPAIEKDKLATHRALLSLASYDSGCKLVTTNFDHLFEAVLQEQNRIQKKNHWAPIRTAQAPHLPFIHKNGLRELVYLHGLAPDRANDLTKTLALVYTSTDFGRAYLAEGWGTRFLQDLFRRYTVCFVGYSLNDVFLRYFVDAYAAGGGGTFYAFADHNGTKRGREKVKTFWEDNGASPILYNHHKGGKNSHAVLHQTLQRWSDCYRQGSEGKIAILREEATKIPPEKIDSEDFPSRVLWALSDPSGIPAGKFRFFASPIEWLEPIEAHFTTLVTRPVGQSYKMALIMIAEWLFKHLTNPKLVLWALKSTSILQQTFRERLHDRFGHIQLGREFERYNEFEATLMQFWKFYADNLINPTNDSQRTTPQSAILRQLKSPTRLSESLKIEIRKTLTVFLSVKQRISLHGGRRKPYQTITDFCTVNIELQQSGKTLLDLLREPIGGDISASRKQEIFPYLEQALRESLSYTDRLIHENCFSFQRDVRSIEDHPQNNPYSWQRSFVYLLRDWWIVIKKQDSLLAREVAERWINSPYLIFQRLALFAAGNDLAMPFATWLPWLTEDDGKRLKNEEFKRELCRLFVHRSPTLSKEELQSLNTTVQRYLPKGDYLRDLYLDKMSKDYDPNSDPNGRKEFNAWGYHSWDPESFVGSFEEIPQEIDGIVAWLKEGCITKRPDWEYFYEGEWRQRCEHDTERSLKALTQCAQDGFWNVMGWEEAFNGTLWGEAAFAMEETVQKLFPLLCKNPKAFKALSPELVDWMIVHSERVSKRRVLSLFSKIARTILDYAWNDPQGDFTPEKETWNEALEALIRIFYRYQELALLRKLCFEDSRHEQRKMKELKRFFSRYCKDTTQKTTFAKTTFASHAHELYEVDRVWASRSLLPLFRWKRAKSENGLTILIWRFFLNNDPTLSESFIQSLKNDIFRSIAYYSSLHFAHSGFARVFQYIALNILESQTKTFGGFSKSEVAELFSKFPSNICDRIAYVFATWCHSQYYDEADVDSARKWWKERIQPFIETYFPKKDYSEWARSSLISLIFYPDPTLLKEGSKFLRARGVLKPMKDPTNVLNALTVSRICAQKACLPEILDILKTILGLPVSPFYKLSPENAHKLCLILQDMNKVDPELKKASPTFDALRRLFKRTLEYDID